MDVGEEKSDPYVSPLNSDSDSASELDHDLLVQNARDSTKVARNDQRLLDEEEEREELLASNGNASQSRSMFRSKLADGIEKKVGRNKRRSRKRKSRRKRGMNDEEGELMFEMEEGGPKSDVSSQASSSSAELDKLAARRRPKSKVRGSVREPSWVWISDSFVCTATETSFRVCYCAWNHRPLRPSSPGNVQSFPE